jgi:hypothetical protein
MPNSVRILALAETADELRTEEGFFESFIPELAGKEVEGGSYKVDVGVGLFNTGWYFMAIRCTNPRFKENGVWVVKRHPEVTPEQLGAFRRDFCLGVHLGLAVPSEILGDAYTNPNGFCFNIPWTVSEFDSFLDDGEKPDAS